MPITAKIILHSKVRTLEEITTWELHYPRFIHSEFMTHRVFSRNAASSRAIPTLKMLRNILKDMAMPVEWGANNPGMQSKSLLTGWKKWTARTIWKTAGYTAVGFAYLMYKCGAHKQIVNRIVEPWSWITVLMTTTQLSNFFELRAHKDAQPEIRELAERMLDAYEVSKPQKIGMYDWHIPFVDRNVWWTGIPFSGNDDLDTALYTSIARAARVSYLNHDGKMSTWDADKKLAAQLIESRPLHASPAEHQVQYNPDEPDPGNLVGPFVQFRKILEKGVYNLKTK